MDEPTPMAYILRCPGFAHAQPSNSESVDCKDKVSHPRDTRDDTQNIHSVRIQDFSMHCAWSDEFAPKALFRLGQLADHDDPNIGDKGIRGQSGHVLNLRT